MNVLDSQANPLSSILAGVAVTPNDAVDLIPPPGGQRPTRGLYIGVAGSIAVQFSDGGAPITLAGAVAGQIYWLSVNRVLAAGTTATNIVALY